MQSIIENRKKKPELLFVCVFNIGFAITFLVNLPRCVWSKIINFDFKLLFPSVEQPHCLGTIKIYVCSQTNPNYISAL